MRRSRPPFIAPNPAIGLLMRLEGKRWVAVVRQLRLTPRQADVLRLVLQAKRDKEIAMALGLGIPTVRMHLRYTFANLGVADRMALALLVIPLLYEPSSDGDKHNTSEML